MRRKHPISLLVAASIAVTPLPAMANDALIGGIVGGIIGGAIANQPKKQRKVYRSSPKKKTYRKSTVNTAQRQQNRDTQTALNYFGFNAGSVDGVMGQRSRNAISQYQATLKYPVTGQLTTYERDFLMSSYYRAQSGGPTTAQLIASSPQGVRGLLVVYRDEQINGPTATTSIGGHYGLPRDVAAAVNEIAKSSDPSAEQLVQRSGFIQLSDMNGDGKTDYIIDTSVTGSAFWCNAQSCQVRVFASTPEGYTRTDFQAFNVTPAMFSCQRGNCQMTGGTTTAQGIAPQPQLPQTQMAGLAVTTPQIATPVPSAQPVVSNPNAAAAAPALPNFMGGQAAGTPSLASHCNTVSLVTSTNGGFVTEATLKDADTALSEQLCLARTYAISSGEALAAKVQGVTQAQIDAQCAAFGPLLKEHVASLSLKEREALMQDVAGFVLGTGMSAQQMAATAKICLSVGYRVDDLDVAIGSALLLASVGEGAYEELMGHHLSQGFGATKRQDLARPWYDAAVSALQNGSPAVFAPGQPERLGLLRKASAMMGAPAMPVDASAPQEAALPVFNVSE